MVRRLAFSVLLSLGSTIASADAVSDAQSSADIGGSSTGTAADIMKNLIDPLMTGALMMNNNKSKSFSVQLGCKANSSFMDMFIQPGPTGDVQNITFQIDTDLDGTLDTTWSAPAAASGICGNGFINCDAGTWNNCQAYKWTTNASKMLDATKVSMQEMGGCYCVNNHCGSGLSISNMSTILTDLGGGAVAALAKQNPGYVTTSVTVAPPQISFRGQQTQGCAAGTIGGTDYVANSGQLTTDAFASAPTNSTYQLIANSSVASQDGATMNSCIIQRVVSLDEVGANAIAEFVAGSGGASSCGPSCLQLTLGTVGDDYWRGYCSYFSETASFNVYRPDRIKSATLVRAKFDDYMQVSMNGTFIWSGPYGNWNDTGPVPGACELYSSWDQYPAVDFTSMLGAPGIVQFAMRTEVAGRGEGFALVRLELDTECKVLPDQINDMCGALQADPTCDLEEEKVDGVSTYANYASTGLIPVTQTQTLSGATCAPTVTRPWFKKERTYRCRKPTTYNFDNALNRKAYVTQSVTPTSYSDQRTNPTTGAVTTSTVALDTTALSSLVNVPACVHVCKAQIARVGNDASINGVVQDTRVTPATNTFVYHECPPTDVCPLGVGETEVQGCSCVNNWAEAASIMQIMRMAGSDIICSSGTPAAK